MLASVMLSRRTSLMAFVPATPLSRALSTFASVPRSVRPVMSATARPRPGVMTLYVKGQRTPGGDLVRGACPFSAKAMLAMRLKGLEYEEQWIDFSAKPDWFLELNSNGSTPTLVAPDAEVVSSSDEIVALADETGDGSLLYREDSPYWDAAARVIAPVFSAFAAVMKNKDPAEEALLKEKLSEALKGVDAHIAKCDEPYLLGDEISAMDINLAPKLQHLVVAGGHFRQVGIEPYSKLQQFYDTITARQEWKDTEPGRDALIDGWAVHV